MSENEDNGGDLNATSIARELETRALGWALLLVWALAISWMTRDYWFPRRYAIFDNNNRLSFVAVATREAPPPLRRK